MDKQDTTSHYQAAKDILGSVNHTAGVCRGLFFTSITTWLYLAVILFNVTDGDVFLAEPLPLPFIQLSVPFLSFFVFAPFIYLLLHFQFVTRLWLLAQKTKSLNAELGQLNHRNAELIRNQLHVFDFVQIWSGRNSEVLRFFLRLVTYTVVYLLPLLILLMFQIRFLSYQNVAVTIWHQFLTLFALGLSMAFHVFVLIGQDRIKALWKWWRRDSLKITSGNEALLFMRNFTGLVGGAFLFFLFIVTGTFSFLSGVIGSPDNPNRGDQTRFVVALIGGINSCASSRKKGGIDPCTTNRTNDSKKPCVTNGKKYRCAIIRKNYGEKPAGYLSKHPRVAKLFPWQRRLSIADENFARFKMNAETFHALVASEGFHSADARRKSVGFAKHLDLSNRNFRFAKFVRVNLTNANLVGADVSGAWVRRSTLNETDFENADFSYASISKGHLKASNLEGTDLSNTHFYKVNLHETNFIGAEVNATDFWKSELDEAKFDGVRQDAISPVNKDSVGPYFYGTDLAKTSFHGADIRLANFTGANLQGSNWKGADARGSNLSGAIGMPEDDFVDLRDKRVGCFVDWETIRTEDIDRPTSEQRYSKEQIDSAQTEYDDLDPNEHCPEEVNTFAPPFDKEEERRKALRANLCENTAKFGTFYKSLAKDLNDQDKSINTSNAIRAKTVSPPLAKAIISGLKLVQENKDNWKIPEKIDPFCRELGL
jgi:uncharacterized protein YjbI with pentapeptide repeats